MKPLDWYKVGSELHQEDLFIIGGGPSLGFFDWEKLRGKNVLACNAAMFLIPEGIARWGTFGDSEFLMNFRSSIRSLASRSMSVFYFSSRLPRSKNHWLRHVRRMNGKRNWGISIFPENGVSWNRSTGAASINLGYLMGAGRIILLGFDMKVDSKGNHNFHSMYGNKFIRPTPEHYKDHLINPFHEIYKDLKVLGVPLIQTNPDSVLSFLPYLPLEELL